MEPTNGNNFSLIMHQLEAALYSPYNQGWQGGLTKGKLDVKRCRLALQGRRDVFRRRWVEESRRAAVSFTIDLSGSMKGRSWINGERCKERKIDAAKRLTLAMGDVCDRNRVAWEVAGFSTSSRFNTSRNRLKHSYVYGGDADGEALERKRKEILQKEGITVNQRGDHESRWLGVWDGGEQSVSKGTCVRFKAFEDVADPYVLSRLQLYVGGGTRDAQVFQHNVNRLAKRPEETKIAIYLGDGQGDGMRFVRAVSDEARKMGVITCGIGLQTTAVKDWAFDATVQVDETEKLSSDAFKLMVDGINVRRKEIARETRNTR